ncbi:MAG: hypothetical protein OXQ30_01270, partial [Boseongicola sp.]|nr:hypothetical protein [Boseongicola sp.]
MANRLGKRLISLFRSSVTTITIAITVGAIGAIRAVGHAVVIDPLEREAYLGLRDLLHRVIVIIEAAGARGSGIPGRTDRGIALVKEGREIGVIRDL